MADTMFVDSDATALHPSKDSMVERVARGIHYSRLGEHPFEVQDQAYKDEIRLKARAAIEAMRDPAMEMMWAGFESGSGLDDTGCSDPQDVARIWRAMIDKALNA